MELQAVRTFVAVADAGGFQAAADDLAVTQQAVSKRIAALERDLGVRLFDRTPRGVKLSVDGQALLTHARELLRAADRAVASVRTDRRPLRVDVLNRRIAPAGLVRAFHRSRPDIDLDVVTLPVLTETPGQDDALAAVSAGTVDVTFRSLTASGGRPPVGLRAAPAIHERHELLVGPRHPLAGRTLVTPADLVDHPIRMFAMPADSEPGAYYRELASAFGLTIDDVAPNFGNEVFLEQLAQSPRLATLVGGGSRYLWPAGYDLRRVPIVAPAPVFPLFAIWSDENPHPDLAALLDHLLGRAREPLDDVWLPSWVAARS